ncbi:MAG: AAA family ATPase [Alphaproteobacteria bacterium]|nr:AAA family ATPase [Alphaproteobacteria bacterium]
MPTIHLIHGFMGFGKTTLAKKLAKELPAIRFTPDEFMKNLHSRNLPDAEFRIAHDKIDNFIWELTEQVINAGVDVILDYGFWSKSHRKNAYEKAKRLTPKVVFHNISCDIKIAKDRVLNRTETNEDELFIDENCFNMFLEKFEPISSDEGFDIINH